MSFKLDKIKMVDASCLSFSILNTEAIDEKEVIGFSFDYNAQTKADSENKLIFIQLKIDIAADVQDMKTKVGSFDFGFTYQVENLDELIHIVEEHKDIDKTLHMSLLGIAFSTARGMIVTRAAKTLLEQAYLPIINPSSLIQTGD